VDVVARAGEHVRCPEARDARPDHRYPRRRYRTTSVQSQYNVKELV